MAPYIIRQKKIVTVFIEHRPNANEVSRAYYSLLHDMLRKFKVGPISIKNEQHVDNDEEIGLLTLEKMRTSEIRSQYRFKTGSDWLPG